MKVRIATSFLVLTVLFAFGEARAATPSWGNTIEEQAAIADLVVVGRIRNISIKIPASGQFDQPWRTVTITIEQNLKGPLVSEIMICTQHDLDRVTHDAVFFLKSATRIPSVDKSSAGLSWVLDERDGGAIDLSILPSHGILSTDLKNGLTRKRILELIQSRCGLGVKRRSETIISPLGYDDGWPCLLEVPLDAPMEDIARQWAASRDGTIRWNAALILRHTQSPQNIAALEQIASSNSDSSKAALSRSLALDQLQRWAIPLLAASTKAVAASILSYIAFVLTVAALLSAGYFWAICRASNQVASLWRIATVMSICTLSLLWAGSYFFGTGFIGGHVEFCLWNGEIVLIYRQHVAIIRSEPFRLATADNLWAVRDYFRGSYHHGILPGQIVAGVYDGGAEVIPEWSRLYGIAIHIWALIAMVLLGPIVIWAISRIKHLIDNRRRGFPVLMSNDNPPS